MIHYHNENHFQKKLFTGKRRYDSPLYEERDMRQKADKRKEWIKEKSATTEGQAYN